MILYKNMAQNAKKQIVPIGTHNHFAHEPYAGLRERKKARIRQELIKATLDLYLERGYSNTRIDDIVQAVDISRRSFFRYFKSKDDVVLIWMEEVGKDLASNLRERPEDEPLWKSLEKTFITRLEIFTQDPVRALRIVKLMSQHPELRVKRYERDLLWKSQLLPEVKRRLGKSKHSELRARVLLTSVLGALNSAVDQWISEDGKSNPQALLLLALGMAQPSDTK